MLVSPGLHSCFSFQSTYSHPHLWLHHTYMSITLKCKLHTQHSFHWLLSFRCSSNSFNFFIYKCCYCLSLCFVFLLDSPSHLPGSRVRILGIIFALSSHSSHPLYSASHKVLKENHHHTTHVCPSYSLQSHCLNLVQWYCQPEYLRFPLLCPSFSLMLVIFSLPITYLNLKT